MSSFQHDTYTLRSVENSPIIHREQRRESLIEFLITRLNLTRRNLTRPKLITKPNQHRLGPAGPRADQSHVIQPTRDADSESWISEDTSSDRLTAHSSPLR